MSAEIEELLKQTKTKPTRKWFFKPTDMEREEGERLMKFDAESDEE